MKASVIIPLHNEQDNVRSVVENLQIHLRKEGIDYEIILVNDNSCDGTVKIIEDLTKMDHAIRVVHSDFPYGFGLAVRKGLEEMKGDVAIIFMGDNSDSPQDAVLYLRTIEKGYDCVFGSRFIKGAKLEGYPLLKLIINRLGNKFIQLLFGLSYNDVTNAFKAYRKEVIVAVQPLLSQHFNLTAELPLKAIVRGFSFAVVPVSWLGRTSGVSKYKINHLIRKYFFSILYVWLEKVLLDKELCQFNQFKR